MSGQRSAVYRGLAEALAEPPAWLQHAGTDWPLARHLRALAPSSEAAQAGSQLLQEITAEPLARRRQRYQALFSGGGRPRFWLYESYHRHGRLLGPASQTLRRLYQEAGLESSENELPDHASIELAFLAFLARQAENDEAHANRWRRLERLFLRRHAGQWLVDVGLALAREGDAVYGPLGAITASWLQEAGRAQQRPLTDKLPIVEVDACTLCGFCVQVCPRDALRIHETSAETTLMLSAHRCVGCGNCVRACSDGALCLYRANEEETGAQWQALCSSPRARCRACGEPLVSQAELAYVARQLGAPHWLGYCLNCRTTYLEKNHELSRHAAI